jgi:hypothetical protein
MNEERTVKYLQHVEHINGHLWHRYSITINQVMVATVKLSKWWRQLNQSSCIVQHMEYISHSWYDIDSRACDSYQYFLDRGLLLTKGSYWLSWSHHIESFTVATMTWLTVMEYLCHKWPLICSTCRKIFPSNTNPTQNRGWTQALRKGK